MAVSLETEVKRRAAERFGLPVDHPGIEGPLEGHHHVAYAVPLPGGGRAKYREPRPGLLRVDPRCFLLEEELLRDLRGRVTRVPEPVGPDVPVQRYIEGRIPRAGGLPGNALSRRHRGRLGQLFGELAAFDIRDVRARRVCAGPDSLGDGDSAGFLSRLIDFTEQRVYREHGADYLELFAELGVRDGALADLKARAADLTPVPSPCSTVICTAATSSSTAAATCGPSTGSSPGSAIRSTSWPATSTSCGTRRRRRTGSPGSGSGRSRRSAPNASPAGTPISPCSAPTGGRIPSTRM